MQQAEQNHTEALASPLIGDSPFESLSRCAELVRFLGAAVSAIQVSGGGVTRDDCATVGMLADMAADAIDFECLRLSAPLAAT